MRLALGITLVFIINGSFAIFGKHLPFYQSLERSGNEYVAFALLLFISSYFSACIVSDQPVKNLKKYLRYVFIYIFISIILFFILSQCIRIISS